MRGKRSKQYRKLMHQYALAFSFREPYQVLLTADIILAAHRYKMNLGSLLSNTLHGEIKPMITQCCIRHLYNLSASPEKDACIAVAKEAERRRCGHHELDEPLSALDCVESVVDGKAGGTNKHKYVVATQELEIRAKMRAVVGVPLIYINKSVMILEPMAPLSLRVKEGDEKAKIRAGLKSSRGAGVEKRKREDESASAQEVAEKGTGGDAVSNGPSSKKRKVKGPKEPNPLSVKKTKKEALKQKSAGDLVEEERAAIRNAAKKDPLAAEKALDATLAMDEDTADGQRKKRTRRRKPKDSAGSTMVADADPGEDS